MNIILFLFEHYEIKKSQTILLTCLRLSAKCYNNNALICPLLFAENIYCTNR